MTIDALGGGSGELGSSSARVSGAPFGFYVQLAMASRLFNIEQGKSIEEYANAGADAQLSGFDAAAILAGGGTAYAFLGMSAPGMAITNSFSPAALGNAAQNVRIGSEINGIDRGYLMDAQGLNLIKAPLTSAGSAMVAAATPTALGGEPWSIAAVIAGSLMTALGNSIQVNPITGERKSQLTQAGQLQTAVSIATAAIGGAYAKSATNVLGVQVTAAQGANAASSFITGGVRTDSSGNVIGYGFGGKEGRARLLRTTAGVVTSVGIGKLPGFEGVGPFAQTVGSSALNRASAVATEYLIQQTLGQQFSGFQAMQRPGLEGFSSLLAGAVSNFVNQKIAERKQEQFEQSYVDSLIQDGMSPYEALSVLYGGAVLAARRREDYEIEDDSSSNERNISTDTGARLAQAALRDAGLLNGTSREERKAAYDKLYVELNKLSSNGLVSRSAIEAITRQVAGDYGGELTSIDWQQSAKTAARVQAAEGRQTSTGPLGGGIRGRITQSAKYDYYGHVKLAMEKAGLDFNKYNEYIANGDQRVVDIKNRYYSKYLGREAINTRVDEYLAASKAGYDASSLKVGGVTALHTPDGLIPGVVKELVSGKYLVYEYLHPETGAPISLRMDIDGGNIGGFNATGHNAINGPTTEIGRIFRAESRAARSAANYQAITRRMAGDAGLSGTSYVEYQQGVAASVQQDIYGATISQAQEEYGNLIGNGDRGVAGYLQFLSNYDILGLTKIAQSAYLGISSALSGHNSYQSMLYNHQFGQTRQRYAGVAGMAALGADLATAIPTGGASLAAGMFMRASRAVRAARTAARLHGGAGILGTSRVLGRHYAGRVRGAFNSVRSRFGGGASAAAELPAIHPDGPSYGPVDYVGAYADNVNSNQSWNWLEHIPNGENLTRTQRSAIRQRAIDTGLIPDVPYKGSTNYLDFEAAGLIERVDHLPEELWLVSDARQFNWLDGRISGGRPDGFTWHHSEIEGRMELVPFGPHNIFNHIGGRSAGHWARAPR